MSFKLILFIIIQLAALIFFVETLRRISKRANEYGLTDTSDTLPFGFVKLRYIVISYVLIYIVWIIISVVLYLTFIHINSPYFYGEDDQPTRTQNEINLNI